MTMVHERTRSIIQTKEFLHDLLIDSSLPAHIRSQADQLLRHYPGSEDIWLAGRLEQKRRDELLKLAEAHGPLPIALGLWLSSEPLFCDESHLDKSFTDSHSKK